MGKSIEQLENTIQDLQEQITFQKKATEDAINASQIHKRERLETIEWASKLTRQNKQMFGLLKEVKDNVNLEDFELYQNIEKILKDRSR